MNVAKLALIALAALVFTACASDGEVDEWVQSGEGIETPAIAESVYSIETNICPDQHSCGGDCTHVDCDGEPGNYFDCRYCGGLAYAEPVGVTALRSGDSGGGGRAEAAPSPEGPRPSSSDDGPGNGASAGPSGEGPR